MSASPRAQYAPDLAKAIGILLVVFGHVLRGLINAGIVHGTAFWLGVDQLIYLFHMPLFFFLSGLFFDETLKRRGYGASIARNVTVLLVPLVVWSYLQFGMQYLAAGSANSTLTLDDVLTAPFPPRQQFWFLWALFKTSVVVGAVMQLKTPRIGLSALLIVAVALNLLGLGEIGSKSWESDVIRNIPYFIVGTLGGPRFSADYRIPTPLLLLAFSCSLALYGVFDQAPEIVRLATSTLCVLALYKIALNVSTTYFDDSLIYFKKVVIFIGMNSMIIYLAHVICEAGFRSLLIKLGINDIPTHILGGLLSGALFPLALVPIGSILKNISPQLSYIIIPVRKHRN